MPEHLESRFLTTPWTLIAGADETASDRATCALTKLCENYRYPIYAFIRKQCGRADQAGDLSQSFFEHLIEKKIYRQANRDRGRFRTFLLGSLKNFLINEHLAANRLKRGGGMQHVSIDAEEAERHFANEMVDDCSAEMLFDREWANAIFDRVWNLLREEFERAGQLDRFDALRANLMDAEDSIPYAEIAQKLELNVAGVKSAAYRLRSRFRELFRASVAQVVEHPAAVDEEISYLMQVLG